MIRARGWMPELARARVRHHDDRRRAVVQRARVARRHLPARLEHGLELRELLERRRAPRAVVGGDAVPRRDLALEEAGVLRGDRALLRALRVAVHVLARDVPLLRDVLRRQPHRDVDVRDRRVVAEQLRVQLLRVLRIAAHLRRRLDAGRHERVALAGADRVEGHADRLQARRAEAVHGRAGNRLGQPGEQRRAAREVHPLPLLRKAAADHHVDDLAAVELGHLLQRGVDRERDEVVGTRVDERALARAADRRARRGDDDGLRHRALPRPCTRPRRRAPASPCPRSRPRRRRSRSRSARAAASSAASRARARASRPGTGLVKRIFSVP